MIDRRLFNLRNLRLVEKQAREKHTGVFYIAENNGMFYAVSGINQDTINQLPEFYYEFLYFSCKPRAQLVSDSRGKIQFLNLQEYLVARRDFS